MTGTVGTQEQEHVRALIDRVRGEGRSALTAPEGKILADAYGITVPGEGLARDVDEAVALADRLGGPVVLKIVSPDILHKTDAGGVVVGVSGAQEVRSAFCTVVKNARAYAADARIEGVQVQQLVPPGQEVIVGAVTDPTFGKVVAFGLGGVLVEVLKDITFRLAPVTADEARSMLDSIGAAEILRGVRARRPSTGGRWPNRSGGSPGWSRTSRRSRRWTSTPPSPRRTERSPPTSGSCWRPRRWSHGGVTAARRSSCRCAG